jgi:hypothetical protein
MKATISELETDKGTLWEGEVLSASWDSTTVEFVIRGDTDDPAFNAVVTSMVEKQRLTVGIENNESTQLVWRGYIGSAKFNTDGIDKIDCLLVMSLDDWFGIQSKVNDSFYC